MAVSIKDIARTAHVSYSTVSRALTGSPRVKTETKERIQRLATEMGYLPSAVARSLVTRHTMTIGVVVTTIADLFFAEVIHAIEETALHHRYSVILANSGADPDRELAAIRAFRERRVDGIILVAGCCRKEALRAEEGIDIPVVIINNVYQEHIGYSVEVDNLRGGREATEHLLDLGHRCIAHIAGPTREWDAVERQSGYEQALQAHGLAVDPSLIVRGDNRPQGGSEAMQQLLALPSRPTGVFCYNDATAIGAMRAARAAGLRIPQDLSVVGFDDIDLAPFFEPPLTTVAQPKRDMGEKAVQMILDLLAGDRLVEDCVLPSRLIVRQSTMALICWQPVGPEGEAAITQGGSAFMPKKRMLAAIFEDEGRLVVRRVPVPTIRTPQDVVVKVEVCGICGTDIRFLAVSPSIQARKGVILGHEYIGQVVEVGDDVPRFRPGDRVAVIPDLPCGYCRFCAEGRPNLCDNMVSIGGDLDGGFAHYALAPAKGLYKISPDLPVEEGAFIELLSCVLGGVQKAALLPGEDAVIIGAGPAGLVYMKAFKAAGAGKVIMAEVSPWRIDFARQAGADLVINPREGDLGEAVRAVTDGGGHVVVDAVGSQVMAAISVARKGGRIIAFGEDHKAECTIRPCDLQGRELRLLGSFIGIHLFPKAVRMLESGAVTLSDLITHRLSLAELPAGIAELAAGRGAKGVCFPWR